MARFRSINMLLNLGEKQDDRSGLVLLSDKYRV